MDIKQLLDQLLVTGKSLADKGQSIAEDKLNIPAEGAEREQALSNMGKGALVAGVLAALVGTRSGRKLSGAAIKLGGLAALGGVAYNAYQKWQGGQIAGQTNGTPVHELTGDSADERSLLLIKTMVSAANADGHIDESEQAVIKEHILQMHLPNDRIDEVKALVDNPLSAEKLAAQVSAGAEASEVYLAARLFISDESGTPEQTYRTALIDALKLDSALVEQLDAGLKT